MTATLRNFDTNRLFMHANSFFIIVGNFHVVDEPLFIGDQSRSFNCKSGITEESFRVLMENAAKVHNLEVLVSDEDVVIIEGAYDDFLAIRQENGPRFSYDFADPSRVKNFINHSRTTPAMPAAYFREVALDA